MSARAASKSVADPMKNGIRKRTICSRKGLGRGVVWSGVRVGMVRAVSGYVCGSFSTLSCGINQEQNRLAVLDQAGLDQAVLDQAGFTQWVLCDGCCLR